MRLDRLLAITVLLLDRKRMSAPELADHFGVTVRTIYRDMDALNEAGIPVIPYPGNAGGFGIMENFTLNRQVFSLKDMMAVLAAYGGITATLQDKDLEVAMAKVKSLVPGHQKAQLEQQTEQLVIDVVPWGAPEEVQQQVQTLRTAISGNQLVRFDYRNYRGEFSERTVEPMTLVYKGYTWYLFSWCREKEDYRLFRLSRIRNLVVPDETFERRDGRYKDVMKDEGATNLKQTDIELKFDAAVRVHVEDAFPPEAITHRDDGSLHVRFTLPVDEWIYGMLLSYGNSIEVLNPPEIRAELAKRAQKTADRHQT